LCKEERWTIMKKISPTPSPWFSSSYFFRWATFPHPYSWSWCWLDCLLVLHVCFGASMLPFALFVMFKKDRW
jgi:hypothetical protein